MSRPKKKYQSINAYVPIQLGNIEEIVLGTDLQADRIRAIYHQLYLKRLADSANDKLVEKDKFKNGWVSLHSSLLKKVATNSFIKYINFLEQKGLLIKRRDKITGSRKYAKNSESQQYKIPEHLLANPAGIRHYRKEKITDHCTLKSIKSLKDSFRESTKTMGLSPIHLSLKKMLKNVRFNVAEAEIFLSKVKNGEIILEESPEETNARNYKEMLLLMDAVNEDNYERTTVDLFGERFHSPITNLWKMLRPFIYFEDIPEEHLVSLDFSNSQPYFSSVAINNNLIEKVLPEYLGIINELKDFPEKADFKKFAELCAKGEIYLYWRDKRGFAKNDEGRHRAKGELFTIMFDQKRKIRNVKKGKHKDFYDMLRIFASNFPSVYSCFYRIKSFDEIKLPFIKNVFVNRYGMFEGEKSYHKALACMMQRMESRIMLHRIAPKLIEAGLTPFVTVHDSVILSTHFAKKAVEIINSEFKALGINPPRINPESLN